ncbi:MAG TPA: TIGR04282 family arsenosugar biosynthesis glycosyltransferase [Pseudolabrys sp.]|jgi:rSAM/selenodomain-associated transferase 1|nr:TIGR04282 family arsenosugar biosynthesis glycosyltransferase [Pseudolabrys sp.]
MSPPNTSPVSISILAKAPIPGFAKARLIPVIGAHAAAVLQERLTERAVATALAAGIGPVTLCCDPDATHDTFLKMVARMKITLRPQPPGDLGARMLAAVTTSTGPVLVIGTDCPALTEAHLRSAAMALRDGNDVVLIPAERNGYVLLGMRKAQPAVFSNIGWGGSSVLADTRARIVEQRLMLVERPPLWEVDTEIDLARLEREFPELRL